MLNIMGVHAGIWLTAGGFYVLDSFFALSGFLITSLLIVEWRKSGTVRLRTFWARRVRRLLPGLLVMLIGVSIIYGLFVPAGTYPTLRGDALSTLFYFANWHFILAGSDYFHQTGLTSPLIHTWSLAVEEQFYLVWPLLVLAVWKIWRSLRALLIVCVAGTLLSALEMALLYNPENTNRLYFGTDTRAQSILVGASLAVGLAVWADHRRKGDLQNWQARTPRARTVLTVIGVLGVIVSILLYLEVNPSDAFAYRGGFLLAALAAAAVLLSVTCAQSSLVARVLSFPVLTFVGRISYGMYLWHYPLFTFINESRTGLSGWPLFFVRVGPTIGVAALSFFFVERPIRQGTFLTSVRSGLVAVPAVGVVIVALVLATMPPTELAPVGAAVTRAIPASPVSTTIPAAYRNTPVRALLVGDSQALTLGLGLQSALSHTPQKFGNIRMLNEGILGCGVADGTTGVEKTSTFIVGAPCTPDPQSADCPPGGLFGPKQNVPCQAWTTAWSEWVGQFEPNVVVLLAGGGEVLDRLYRGQMTNILNPTFAAYVWGQLQEAFRIATAGGALMVLMTKPCQDSGEQPNGDPWPDDSSARQNVYNSMLHRLAAEHPNQVYLQDLNSYVCPKNTYAQDLNGVPIRDPDGIHFDLATGTGGAYLAPAILPYWVEIGHVQEALTGGASVHLGALPRFFAPQ
jgi:peptidoglycan/LPS O-acetylase OafA/YrhL